MIKSILNKGSSSIDLSKIILKQSNLKVILDPTDIKNKITDHYANITNKNNTSDQTEWNTWSSKYTPKSTINPNWYNTIFQPITVQEIQGVINKTKAESAPGLFCINYAIFKHLGPTSIKRICLIFNQIITTQQIPNNWQKNLIHPIPKKKDWEHDLNHTHPITLLETIKKIFTKVLNNKLTQVLTKHNIFSPLNWAGLPQGGTREPINILNCIMEEAREFMKECWILSQDMSKAYDSINIQMLEKALLRIQIPNNIIQIIINLISNRTNQIITPHGLTNPYQVLGGIDQGDTLSPLLWRIYYDPLISHINKTLHGYHFKVHSNFLGTNNPKTQKTYFTSITFMDDTTWITRSKQDLEHIIHIANFFYKLNNLHINPQKSTLITINTKNNSNNIQFTEQTIHAQHKHDPIRILEIWITSSGKKTHQKNLIKEKTKNITQIISWKRITDKQCRYILNYVLMPALEYLLLDIDLYETVCKQIKRYILQ